MEGNEEELDNISRMMDAKRQLDMKHYQEPPRKSKSELLDAKIQDKVGGPRVPAPLFVCLLLGTSAFVWPMVEVGNVSCLSRETWPASAHRRASPGLNQSPDCHQRSDRHMICASRSQDCESSETCKEQAVPG